MDKNYDKNIFRKEFPFEKFWLKTFQLISILKLSSPKFQIFFIGSALLNIKINIICHSQKGSIFQLHF